MRARYGAAASPRCLRATMDVTTTLVQKLGRMMLRLHEAPATTFPFSDRVDGSPWSLTFSPVVDPYSGNAHVGGSARAIPVDPKAAVLGVKDQFRRWTHKGLTRLPRYQSSHVRPSLNRRYSCPRPSSVGHPREGVLTEPCLGRTVSSRLSIITGRQGYPITSMKVQKYTCATAWRSDPIT